MIEKIMDVNAIPLYLTTTLQSKKVRVQENGRIITIVPLEDFVPEEEFDCPFYGIAVDSTLTVDKFLEWKREEREAEYEKNLHS
jgi:hypothetical protein